MSAAIKSVTFTGVVPKHEGGREHLPLLAKGQVSDSETVYGTTHSHGREARVQRAEQKQQAPALLLKSPSASAQSDTLAKSFSQLQIKSYTTQEAEAVETCRQMYFESTYRDSLKGHLECISTLVTGTLPDKVIRQYHKAASLLNRFSKEETAVLAWAKEHLVALFIQKYEGVTSDRFQQIVQKYATAILAPDISELTEMIKIVGSKWLTEQVKKATNSEEPRPAVKHKWFKRS